VFLSRTVYRFLCFMFPFGRLLVLIFSLVVPAIFDPIAYLYLFSQQINIHMQLFMIIVVLIFTRYFLYYISLTKYYCEYYDKG